VQFLHSIRRSRCATGGSFVGTSQNSTRSTVFDSEITGIM